MNLKVILVFFAVGLLLAGCIQMPGGTASSGGSQTGGTQQTGGQQTAASGTTAQSGTTTTTQTTQNQTGTQTSGTSSTQQTSLESTEINYTSGAWRIYGTVYDSKNDEPTKAIILVHDLGKTRDAYSQDFIERLHDSVPDAMIFAIDLRGHGKSTNLGTYQSFDMATFKDMKTDVLGAKNYFKANHPTVNEYYVVGASIGSTAGILAAAQDMEINKLVMISPGMEYKNVSIDRAAEDYLKRLMLVASSGDSYSVDGVEGIDELSHTTHKTIKIYPGSAHGTDLFAATEGDSEPLDTAIINFLK